MNKRICCLGVLRSWACLALLVFVCGCAPTILAPENAQELSPNSIAEAFAQALLVRADSQEAQRWAQTDLKLTINSQVHFVQSDKRVAEFSVEGSKAKPTGTEVLVSITKLAVGQTVYTGHLTVLVEPVKHVIVSSELVLKTTDGKTLTF